MSSFTSEPSHLPPVAFATRIVVSDNSGAAGPCAGGNVYVSAKHQSSRGISATDGSELPFDFTTVFAKSTCAGKSAEWIARQLTEAYGWQQAPRYIIRDRDRVYGGVFARRLRAMGIRDRPIAPRSPWQNGCAERLIGSIRRDCLDHVVVFGERHLRHLLKSYQKYYNEARTHLSLQKDAPIPRAVQTVGQTLAVPILGGLHHQYIRA